MAYVGADPGEDPLFPEQHQVVGAVRTVKELRAQATHPKHNVVGLLQKQPLRRGLLVREQFLNPVQLRELARLPCVHVFQIVGEPGAITSRRICSRARAARAARGARRVQLLFSEDFAGLTAELVLWDRKRFVVGREQHVVANRKKNLSDLLLQIRLAPLEKIVIVVVVVALAATVCIIFHLRSLYVYRFVHLQRDPQVGLTLVPQQQRGVGRLR
mmetsp:Transcript_23082/g.58307  ORF Transcript_23082/g.58307 Transcript_23082/m.58307 type:complete len:215 (-) Transcript_23082:591-1235(-)